MGERRFALHDRPPISRGARSFTHVRYDPGWRVVQLVTTIQTRGAERVTLDLAAELPRFGARVCVAAFAGAPPGWHTRRPLFSRIFSQIIGEPAARAQAVADLCQDFGADRCTRI